MLRFQVFHHGELAKQYPLQNAYMLGSDQSTLRGEVSFQGGLIHCDKRESGTASFVLQHAVGDCGQITVQTCLLPERDEPYVLTLELARHRLMTLYAKLEDWAMFELDAQHPAMKRFEIARRLFIKALCLERQQPAQASRVALRSLISSIDGSEELALAHSELLLNRRKITGSLPRYPIGCGVALDQTQERIRAGLLANFDMFYLPVTWRSLAPEEGEYRWEKPDDWAQWIGKQRMPVLAGPIISFDPRHAPDWLYIWEHDYDTVRDLVYDHTQRVVTRYRNVVTAWNVVSGLHLNRHFSFSFEQLMDLTRMTTMLVKKIQPAARALVEISQPFGEAPSGQHRSIPALMYADLMIQRTVSFDGFVIKLLMGETKPGRYVRDLMQISHLLDQFLSYDKPVNVVIAVPSSPSPPPVSTPVEAPVPTPRTPNSLARYSSLEVPRDLAAAKDASRSDGPSPGGYWRRPWSDLVQSRWLEAVYQMALSKPFVESVTWLNLIDHDRIELPASGLLTQDLQPKTALKRLVVFRNKLLDLQPTTGSLAPHPTGSDPTASTEGRP